MPFACVTVKIVHFVHLLPNCSEVVCEPLFTANQFGSGTVSILFGTAYAVVERRRWRDVQGRRSGCQYGTPGAMSGDATLTSWQPRSNKRLASLAKSATEDCGLAFFRGRLVLSFQFRQVCQ